MDGGTYIWMDELREGWTCGGRDGGMQCWRERGRT